MVLAEMEHCNRLPTLMEVLNRRTLAPVDLFSFYIYMRDQQCSVDYLDFWLDVSQHMSLCRHYVRELRRSVLLDTPEAEKAGSPRSSDAFESDDTGAGPSGYESGGRRNRDMRLSAFLRSESHTSGQSVHSTASNQSPHRTQSNDPPPRPGNLDPAHTTGNTSNSPGRTVARADIRASAERILYTYLLPGSEREVILPENIVEDIVHMIEREGRDDPEVFDTAKDYVFQAMERDAFPGYLQAKALGNLVPPSILARLVLALASFGGGFWAAFYVVLTDQPKSTRCWVILPFVFAAYFLSSYQYKIDPIFALAGFSEYTFFTWAKIREPYVRSLLNKRASVSLLLAAFVAVVFCVLFIFVPGTRL
ncbi:RGS domain-containing protein [Blastomyces dermatitidis ER-3]|uniref:RGS domain-containing protein n=3 Tax=Blastomyces TaxID=229219 RepID=A0A179UFC1_BLAGS|nr:RGS domain-containing protein [Blastomyces gilchristii SLH14081]XP_045275359.1 RGS domain-containing protein [Blastomyces dermatitidis ER-3]EGE85536.1 RGS domain-containing protein [Blastomyces dermatitidis ATCC 18188]EQL32146.1 hypothetical protein BDFG_05628 [Blastomyces dermatitidis ATCC 26199]EEQ88171.1 RGS domain-containing protein [Blastomyces dermatitidis ER-3]OAT05978.1 RGS domain-containing protein [Blastomyces gilchristii SLH14081]